MIEETPTHRAPQGIVLAIAIMTVLYAAAGIALWIWLAAPDPHCRQTQKSAATIDASRPLPACTVRSDKTCPCPPR